MCKNTRESDLRGTLSIRCKTEDTTTRVPVYMDTSDQRDRAFKNITVC